MKNNNLDNNRKAKQYKVLPHNYFPDYKYSFWIDASLTIKGSIREYIKRYLKNEILCVLHPNYDDINDELKDSFFKLRYPKYILNKQVDYYKNKGLPPHFGMVLTGVLFRQHNNPKIIYLMELWWKEIIDYSTQCQISFPYVMWENDFHPSVSPINIFNNEYWFTSKKGNLHAIEEKSFLNSNNLLMNIEKNNFNYSLNNNDLHLIYNDLKILENIQIDDIEFSFWEAFKLKIKRLRIYFILWYVWNILKKSL